MTGCVFCGIVDKRLKASIIYEDDFCLAFEDINPQAPVHFLVIPKRHIADVLEADKEIKGRLLEAATIVAREKGLADDGFRTVINCKRHAGQSVDHLHIHILGGRWFTWPPG